MIVISSSVVLGSGTAFDNGNNPLIGFRSILTPSNVEADFEDSSYPITNITNDSTIIVWRSTSNTEQYVTFNTADLGDIDYIGIARHNFASIEVAVSVEGTNDITSPIVWDELTTPAIPADDSPIMFRIPLSGYQQLRIRIQSGDIDFPSMGVVYCGRLLILQRRIYVGHTPMKYGRQFDVLTGVSEKGDFLGRVQVSQTTATNVSMKNITPTYYRTEIDPFFKVSGITPFFFAWRPLDYPNEVGFAWVTDDPKISNQLPNGMVEISFSMDGINQ